MVDVSVQLVEKLKPFELDNLDRINLIEHPEKRGKNRGYAFLDFRTHVDAVAAFLKLQERDLFLGTDFRAHISFSNTLSQDDEIMEKVHQLSHLYLVTVYSLRPGVQV
jgi:hypothetical protein